MQGGQPGPEFGQRRAGPSVGRGQLGPREPPQQHHLERPAASVGRGQAAHRVVAAAGDGEGAGREQLGLLGVLRQPVRAQSAGQLLRLDPDPAEPAPRAGPPGGGTGGTVGTDGTGGGEAEESGAQPGKLGQRRPRVVAAGAEPPQRQPRPAARAGQVARHLRRLRPGELGLGQMLVAPLPPERRDGGVKRRRGVVGQARRQQRARPVGLQARQHPRRGQPVRPRGEVEPAKRGRDVAAEQVAAAEVLRRLGGHQRKPGRLRDRRRPPQVTPGQPDRTGIEVQHAAVEQHPRQQLGIVADQRLGRGQLAQRVRPAPLAHQHQAALGEHDAAVGRIGRPFRLREQR